MIESGGIAFTDFLGLLLGDLRGWVGFGRHTAWTTPSSIEHVLGVALLVAKVEMLDVDTVIVVAGVQDMQVTRFTVSDDPYPSTSLMGFTPDFEIRPEFGVCEETVVRG